MPAKHLDPKVFDRLLQGTASEDEVRELALHLMEACSDCAHAIETDWAADEEFLESSSSGGSTHPTSGELSCSCEGSEETEALESVFESVQARIQKTLEVVRNEQDDAQGVVSNLLRQPASRRRLLVYNNPRLQTLPVAELLLDSAWEQGFEAPADADALAELTLELMDKIEQPSYGQHLIEDVRGRAWTLRGNFRRILGDLRGAEDAFMVARRSLDRGSGDLLERARLLTLESTLRRQQSQREVASELLDQAIKIYRLLDEGHMVGRTMINQALLLHEKGEVEAAISVLREAQALVEPSREPHLLRVMQHNLVGYLCDLGRYEEAMGLIPSLRTQIVQDGSLIQLLRLRWREGQIHLGLGNETRAESAFLEVRRGFLEHGLSYDVALISLELSALYVRQGRTSEIRELAGQMFPIFQSRDLHQEAIAALLLFQRAVEMDTLTLRMVEEVADVVRRSQEKPRPRTPEPS